MYFVLDFPFYNANASFFPCMLIQYVMRDCECDRCDGVSGDITDTCNYALHGIVFLYMVLANLFSNHLFSMHYICLNNYYPSLGEQEGFARRGLQGLVMMFSRPPPAERRLGGTTFYRKVLVTSK